MNESWLCARSVGNLSWFLALELFSPPESCVNGGAGDTGDGAVFTGCHLVDVGCGRESNPCGRCVIIENYGQDVSRGCSGEG